MDEEEQQSEPIMNVSVEPERETNEEALADMFEVPQPDDNDMRVDHLVELDEEENLDDLVDVDFDKDIIGDEEPEQPAQPKPRFRISPRGRRVIQRFQPPQQPIIRQVRSGQ